MNSPRSTESTPPQRTPWRLGNRALRRRDVLKGFAVLPLLYLVRPQNVSAASTTVRLYPGDDLAGIVNASPGSGVDFILSGIHLLALDLNLRSNKLIGDGNSPTINLNGQATIRSEGSLGAGTLFTQDAYSGSSQVLVANGTLFTVDSYVLLFSNHPWSEMHKVVAVQGNILFLDSPLLQEFAVSRGATAYQVYPVSPQIANLHIAGGLGHSVTISRAINWAIESAVFQRVGLRAVQNTGGDLVHGKIRTCTFDRPGNLAVYLGLGCYDNDITKNLVNSPGASGILGQGNGPNNISRNCITAPVGTHIQLESSFGSRITANELRGGNNDGIILRNWLSGGLPSNGHSIRGNRVLDCEGDAIILDGADIGGNATPLSDNLVVGNYVRSKLGNGIITYNANRSRIMANHAARCNTVLASGIAITGAADHCTAQGNVCSNNHYGLRLEGGPSYCTIGPNALVENVVDLYTNLLGPGNVIRDNI